MWCSAWPCGFLCLFAFPMKGPNCFLAVHVWELSFPQSLSLHQIWLIASLWNVSADSIKIWSNVSLLETLLHLSYVLHCYFWKIPDSQGALCFPSVYDQGKTNHSEKQQSFCVSNYNPWWSHRAKGRIPLLPRELGSLCGELLGAVTVAHAFQTFLTASPQ